MPSIKAVLEVLNKQLVIAERYPNEIDGLNSAIIALTNAFVKPKKEKKENKRQLLIKDLHRYCEERNVHSIVFSEEYTFVWQYRINCADVNCEIFDAKGEDADTTWDIHGTLQELFRKQIKNFESVSGEQLLKLFKGTDVVLKVTDDNDVVRDMTRDDEWDVEEGYDS